MNSSGQTKDAVAVAATSEQTEDDAAVKAITTVDLTLSSDDEADDDSAPQQPQPPQPQRSQPSQESERPEPEAQPPQTQPVEEIQDGIATAEIDDVQPAAKSLRYEIGSVIQVVDEYGKWFDGEVMVVHGCDPAFTYDIAFYDAHQGTSEKNVPADRIQHLARTPQQSEKKRGKRGKRGRGGGGDGSGGSGGGGGGGGGGRKKRRGQHGGQ